MACVEVPFTLTVAGLKVQLERDGREAQLKLTEPEKPDCGVMLTLMFDVLWPAFRLADAGVTEI